MAIYKEYKDIYKNQIEDMFNTEIAVYPLHDNKKTIVPLSHNCKGKCSACSHDCYKALGELMRKNLVFYCYGEEEVVKKYKNGLFSNLEKAIKYAYKNRLPKRIPNQDGLPSEVLFDLLIQSLLPDAYKLAVRAILRQDDNNEIKGYDLTYFTNENGQITLWLGQAKLGDESYCKSGINQDLTSKFDTEYLSKQIFFIAEKQVGLSDEGIQLTDIINQLNMITIEQNEQNRAKAFIDFLLQKNISINIPCLLAYGKDSIYQSVSDVEEQIDREVERIEKYFDSHKYVFSGFYPNLLFFVFPIENLIGLRSNGGFYEGLH